MCRACGGYHLGMCPWPWTWTGYTRPTFDAPSPYTFTPSPRLSDEDVERIADRVIAKQRENAKGQR